MHDQDEKNRAFYCCEANGSTILIFLERFFCWKILGLNKSVLHFYNLVRPCLVTGLIYIMSICSTIRF